MRGKGGILARGRGAAGIKMRATLLSPAAEIKAQLMGQRAGMYCAGIFAWQRQSRMPLGIR